MPRPKKAPAGPPNSLVASAVRVNSRRVDVPKGNGEQPWQTEAWHFADTVGELAAVLQWVSNTTSKVRLRVMYEQTDGTKKEVTTGPPVDVLNGLFNGETGQPQMMGAFGTHLSAPGETYLVGIPPEPDDAYGRDEWSVMSSQECKLNGSTWEINRGDGVIHRYPDGTKEGTEAGALVIRIWRSHPRLWVEATSAVRAALPILRELEALTKHTAAVIDSRLAGAGLLLLPSEMTFQTPATNDGAPAGDVESDDFMAVLTEAMVASLTDRGNASAVVPVVVKAPGAFLGSVQHITFSTELTGAAQELRKELIGRLALSLDVPPEVLLGNSDSNHWNAWLVSEDAIKIHIAPLVELICEALTTKFLWPALQGMAETLSPEIRRYSIDADTSALRLRPDRTAQAVALHADMAISDAALFRETGFDTGDIPGDDEIRRRLLLAVAKGTTTPDLVASALSQLGVSLTPAPSSVPGDEKHPVGSPTGPAPVAAAPAVPAVEAPRNPPGQDQTAALVAAGELMVLRAVERANNRFNNRGKHRRPIAAPDLDTALTGAWSHAPRVAALCGVDSTRLIAACDEYSRTLLTSGADHDEVKFSTILKARVLS